MKRILRPLQCITVAAVCVGGVQAASAQEQESKKNNEIRYTMTIKTTPPARQRCSASLEFTFQQKNTVAAVDTTLVNPDCGASSGEYTFLVRFRDDSNEVHTLEYPVTWQRDDDLDLETHNEYSIGDNVDLVTVRSRSMSCFCDVPGEDTPSPEE